MIRGYTILYITHKHQIPYKKYISNNHIFHTYEGNTECQVENNILPSNVPDCMFEVESVVDMSILIKKNYGKLKSRFH